VGTAIHLDSMENRLFQKDYYRRTLISLSIDLKNLRGWQEEPLKKRPQWENLGSFFSFCLTKFCLAHYNNVGCLWAFRTIGNLELYLIAFIERLKPVSLNGGEVYENIISVISGNEPIALLLIKPFYTTFGHYNSPPFFI
jgi:hypothetical protein